MAGIISEEPPNSGLQLYELIGDFIKNGNKVNEKDAQDLSEEVFKELREKNIIE